MCIRDSYYLELKTKGVYTWEERWKEGIWLGVREQSGEIIVGTKDGVVKCRTFKRKATEEERWDVKFLDEMVGVPWMPLPGRYNVDLQIKVKMPEGSDDLVEMPVPREEVRLKRGFTSS